MRTKKKTLAFASIAVATAVLLAGCSSSNPGGTSTSAAACQPSKGKVTLNFTTWVPGIQKVVQLWNEKNPDIQVKVQTGPNGNSGTYKNFSNELKAGNAPDLGQIEYDTLPSFRVQDGLENLAVCKDVASAKGEFLPWVWNQVSLGSSNAVYGVPQDSGPMAMYYRKDLFEKNNIPIPTTWAQYKDDAVKIKALGGYITNFSPTDVNQFAGLVWQAGGKWFSNNGKAWTVNLTDSASQKVADYWNDLIKQGLVTTNPGFTDAWNNGYNSGQDWTWNSAVWGANTISSGAPATAGDWAVAPMPQWDSGSTASGNWGGSSVVVFKDTKHLYEAAKFALWLNTSPEALEGLNKQANLYPTTKAGLKLPVLQQGVPFFGNQPIYKEFAKAASQVSPDFTWGPTMTQTYSDVSDGFKAAIGGGGTLLSALQKGQASTIQTLKEQSIPVN